MQPDSTILQTSIPEHICDAFLSWTLCAYYVDPVIVSIIVIVAAAAGIFVYLHRTKKDTKDVD